MRHFFLALLIIAKLLIPISGVAECAVCSYISACQAMVHDYDLCVLSKTKQAFPGQLHRSGGARFESEFSIRALSLENLQSGLAACVPKSTCSKEQLQLGGLTKPLGLIVDRTRRDLIVFGLAEEETPPIKTGDFVIALRNVWLRYAPLKGNVYQYSYPGCDIRPPGATVNELDRVRQQIFRSDSPEKVERMLKVWRKTCETPQKVSVFGIPFDSHFSQVMVKADYDMKQIADGSDQLELPGLTSLSDMRLDQVRKAVLAGRRQFNVGSSMNRFWLSPAENLYEESDGIVLIKQSPVQILTHPIGANRRGQIADVHRRDQLAGDFARCFSILYDKVAEKRRVYRELDNLYKVFALTKIIKSEKVHRTAILDLGYLLDDFPVHRTKVAKQLPGRHTVRRLQHRRDFSSGYETIQLWLPSCGGVEMTIEPEKTMFRTDTSGLLADFKNYVLEARLSPQSLSWSIPIHSGSRLMGLQHGLRLSRINRASSNILVLTVIDAKSEYRVYDGGPGELYRGLNVEHMMRQMHERLQSQLQRNTVYLQLEGFSKDKQLVFEQSCRMNSARLRPKYTLRTLSNIAGTIEEEQLFSPGMKFRSRSGEVERIRQGRHKSLYKGAAKFFVGARRGLRKIKVTVIAQTAQIVEDFLDRLGVQFSVTSMLPLSPVDLVNYTRHQLIREQKLKEKTLEIRIETESSIHVVERQLLKSGKEG